MRSEAKRNSCCERGRRKTEVPKKKYTTGSRMQKAASYVKRKKRNGGQNLCKKKAGMRDGEGTRERKRKRSQQGKSLEREETMSRTS
jgi:hypothetical protein